MVPEAARKDILDSLVMDASRHYLQIHLAKVNPTPVDAKVTLADLIECDFDGYTMLQPAWGTATLDTDGVASIETGVVEWTAGSGFTGSQTIFGVYATWVDRFDGSTVRFAWWDRLTATVTLAAVGQKFRRVCDMQGTNYAP